MQENGNSFMNGSQHQRIQLAVIHRGGKDDLGAGGAQLLELQDQVFSWGMLPQLTLTRKV